METTSKAGGLLAAVPSSSPQDRRRGRLRRRGKGTVFHHPNLSVLGRILDVIDDEYIDRAATGLQLEPELLLKGREDGRTVGVDAGRWWTTERRVILA